MGQRAFLILGSLGLIPFIAIFSAYFISPPEEKVYEFLIYLFVACLLYTSDAADE